MRSCPWPSRGDAFHVVFGRKTQWSLDVDPSGDLTELEAMMRLVGVLPSSGIRAAQHRLVLEEFFVLQLGLLLRKEGRGPRAGIAGYAERGRGQHFAARE